MTYKWNRYFFQTRTAQKSLDPNIFYVIWNCQYIDEINLANGIIEIGERAFCDCRISTMVLPNTLEKIGDYAFYNCFRLGEIILPNTVTSIGGHSFYYCNNLSNIVFSTSMTTIPEYAFSHCTVLTRVEIPANIEQIKGFAFFECEELETIIVYRETPPALIATGFDRISDAAKFYVPDDSVDLYKQASIWSRYASRIYPISDLPV